MSADPKHVSAHLSDPQSFNRYAYARNNPLLYVDPNGEDFEKAWKDAKTFVNSLYVKVSGGGGFGFKGQAGKFKSEVGAFAHYSAETGLSGPLVTVSKSVEARAGVEAGEFKHTAGPSVEQVIATVNTDLSVDSKPGMPTVDANHSIGTEAAITSSDDKVGIGVELGFFLSVGGEFGGTKEGFGALKNVPKEVKDSLTNPGPPPTPKPPPPPPTCAGDQKKPCQ